MRILLAAPLFQEGATAHFVLKALNELGHSVYVWDYRISPKPPTNDYDLAIAWTTEGVHNYLKSPKVLIYLDDNTYWKRVSPGRTIENFVPYYDYVFTFHKTKRFEKNWMPMGCDPEIHKPLNQTKTVDVCFIGTNRYRKREELVKRLQQEFPSFALYGNGWGRSARPAYFHEFNSVCNSTKIVIAEHFNTGPSDKDFEIPACGGALMISDYYDGIKEIYPQLATTRGYNPIYRSTEEAIDLIRYYLKREGLRVALVKEMQKQAYQFTYKNQLSKILKEVEG